MSTLRPDTTWQRSGSVGNELAGLGRPAGSAQLDGLVGGRLLLGDQPVDLGQHGLVLLAEVGAELGPPTLEVAAGLLVPDRLGRLGGEQEPGQGATLGQMGGPQLAGGAAPGSMGAGDVAGDAGELADQVALPG